MRAIASVFAIVLLASLLMAGGHLYSPDDEVLFRVSQSIAFRGELAIEPIDETGFATATGRDGRQYAQYGVGQALLAVPFLWVGQAFSGSDAVMPPEYPQRLAASFLNAFVAAALAAMLCWLALRITSSVQASVAAGLAYGLATMALPHSRTFFTEPLATLCVFSAFALIYAGCDRRSLWRLAVGGTLAGYSVLTRIDSVVAMPALLVFLAWSLFWDETPDSARRLKPNLNKWSLSGLAAFLIPLALAAVAVTGLNCIRFGGPLSTGYGDQPEGVQFLTPILVGLHGFLFSPGRGLIFFSPPLILALWAFGSLLQRNRRVAICAGLLIASVLAFHSKWQNWAGGWCWGPRHIFMIHVFLALPLAAWLAEEPERRVRRWALGVLFIAGLLVQIYGCSQHFYIFYREYFQNPAQEPRGRVLYAPGETPVRLRPDWQSLPPERQFEPVTTDWMSAPINDSVYVPQNSCWYGYKAMWSLGWHDFLWLRVLGYPGTGPGAGAP